MLGRLSHLTDAFDKRMKLRRRMMAHLGININSDQAPDVQQELSATLLACGSCQNTDICEGWLNSQSEGMPMFCGARNAFQDLQYHNLKIAEAQAN